jgi:uncharacterized membrane protein
MIWLVVFVLALVFYFMVANLREEWKTEIRDLRARLFHLEQRVADLLARRTTTSEPAKLPLTPAPAAEPEPEAAPGPEPNIASWLYGEAVEQPQTEPEAEAVEEAAFEAAPPPVIPPVFGTSAEPPRVRSFRSPERFDALSKSTPPPEPPPVPPLCPPIKPAPAEPTFFEKLDWSKVDWEQFMGVKLFAWIGGLALFIGVAFFVRYSFEHNLIPPWVRVMLGMLTGLGLVGGAVTLLRRQQYVIPAQSLCATGIVILYAAVFGACPFYQLIGTKTAFLGMSAITIGAFLLAAWFDALVIAILGMLGGFLTPYLLRTGQDAPFALFSYIALLDAGLIALALRKRWNYLTTMGAIGTVIMQAGWVMKFFDAGKAPIAFTVFLGFGVLFGAALAWAKRREQDDQWFVASAVLMALSALVFAFVPLDFEALGGRPGMIFGYLLLVALGCLALYWLEKLRCRALPVVAACGTMLVQAGWVTNYFERGGFAEGGQIFWAFAVFLSFAAMFLGAFALAQKHERSSAWLTTAAALLPGAGLTFALWLMAFPTVGLRPGILFGYVLLVDLIWLAMYWLDNRSCGLLSLLAAGGTVAVQASWVFHFFVRGGYDQGSQIFTAFAVFLGFAAMFLSMFTLARWRERGSSWLNAAAAVMPCAALAFGLYLMDFASLGARPGVLFGYILLADLCLLALVWIEEKLVNLQFVAGGAAFLLLGVWMVKHLTNALLPWGLTGAMGFALLHALVPVALAKRRPNAQPAWLGQLFPPIALALVLLPILRNTELSFLIWPCVLLLDLFIAVLAVITASTVVIAVALILTLAGAGFWLVHIPADMTGLPMGLVLLAGFAVLFFAIGAFLPRLLAGSWRERFAFADAGTNSLDAHWRQIGQADFAKQLPAMSAIMPFLLLIMVTLRLPLADPPLVFGVAMLLVVMLLGLTAWLVLDWLPAVGLVCVLALEHTWHFGHFHAASATVPLLWYLGFAGAFTVAPFFSWQRLSEKVVPWATAALALPLHFYLIHNLVKASWHSDFMGLLPAAMALPAAAGFAFLLKKLPADAPKRLALLALFGGATLFFITLIFPIQFHRQFVTIGWALEGAALLWLYRRVPHNGLRLTGLALLITAFVRLALNPAVLEYHARTGTPILNWYLYAYGITVACLFAGAWLLSPPRHQVMGSNVQAVLNALGTVLAFLLLNMEIADFYTEPGARALTFEFSGNLARDMTYSVAWGLFALTLLMAGFVKKIPAARWAGIALLCVTLAKLFLHDLWSLGQLYLIGAFIGVAVIAIAASFLYSRFLKPPGANPPKE